MRASRWLLETRARETHGDEEARGIESYAYFDDAGRTRMTKVMAAPGLAPERNEDRELELEEGEPVLVDMLPDVPWIGSGRTVSATRATPSSNTSRARSNTRTRQHNIVDDDPVLYATTSVLDVQGNVLAVYDPRANAVDPFDADAYAQQNVHGMLGQVLKTLSHDAGDRVMLADVSGSPLRAWNDRGFASRFEYDELRRPTRQWVKPGVEDEQLVVVSLYGEMADDPEDNNLRGRPYRVYDGAGAVTSEVYDFKGNLTRQTRRLAVAYKTTPDWVDLAAETTLADIATAAEPLLEDEVFATEAAFDALGRPTEQTTPDDSVTLHTYDEGGRLLTVQSKLRGAVTATAFIDAIEYDAKGQRLRVELANNTTTEYEYDPETFRVRRIRTDRSVNAAVMQDLKYTYDPVGNITEIRDDSEQTVYFDNTVVDARQTFLYDAIYRLIEATGRETPNGQPNHEPLVPSATPPPNDPSAVIFYTERYTYDAAGNIVTMQHIATDNNWTRHYQYQYEDGMLPPCNRLLHTSLPDDPDLGPYTGDYPHDEHGNMTAMPHLAGDITPGLTWDHADQLQSTNPGNNSITYYTYDAVGERVRKITLNPAETTSKERIYVGSWEVYRERHNLNTSPVLDLERETLHIHDDTGRVVLVETKTVEDDDPIVDPVNIARYQYSNHLGSAALELDADGEIISYEEYYPFGSSSYVAANSAIEVSAKRYRYTGKERDEETGLSYHDARYHISWIGRWSAADPIGISDGTNVFSYTSNNPVNNSDPSGNRTQSPIAPDAESSPSDESSSASQESVEDEPEDVEDIGIDDIGDEDEPDFDPTPYLPSTVEVPVVDTQSQSVQRIRVPRDENHEIEVYPPEANAKNPPVGFTQILPGSGGDVLALYDLSGQLIDQRARGLEDSISPLDFVGPGTLSGVVGAAKWAGRLAGRGYDWAARRLIARNQRLAPMGNYQEWRNFRADLGADIVGERVGGPWFWPRYKTSIQILDKEGTWAYRDTAGHEGFHAFVGKYFGFIWKMGEARIGSIPVGAPVLWAEETLAFAAGRINSLRLHRVIFAPYDAFRLGLTTRERAYTKWFLKKAAVFTAGFLLGLFSGPKK